MQACGDDITAPTFEQVSELGRLVKMGSKFRGGSSRAIPVVSSPTSTTHPQHLPHTLSTYHSSSTTPSLTYPTCTLPYEQIGEMRYTHAVAMEVLRLHPSVPKDVKFAVKNDVLPDGTEVRQQRCTTEKLKGFVESEKPISLQ